MDPMRKTLAGSETDSRGCAGSSGPPAAPPPAADEAPPLVSGLTPASSTSSGATGVDSSGIPCFPITVQVAA